VYVRVELVQIVVPSHAGRDVSKKKEEDVVMDDDSPRSRRCCSLEDEWIELRSASRHPSLLVGGHSLGSKDTKKIEIGGLSGVAVRMAVRALGGEHRRHRDTAQG
jgi:hypothetical protein